MNTYSRLERVPRSSPQCLVHQRSDPHLHVVPTPAAWAGGTTAKTTAKQRRNRGGTAAESTAEPTAEQQRNTGTATAKQRRNSGGAAAEQLFVALGARLLSGILGWRGGEDGGTASEQWRNNCGTVAEQRRNSCGTTAEQLFTALRVRL